MSGVATITTTAGTGAIVDIISSNLYSGNLVYGTVAAGTTTGNLLLLQDGAGADVFKVWIDSGARCAAQA